MTVREATLDVARRCGLTTWFGNPGSTEIPLLAGLPADIHYVLALHEAAAAGMACGYALGTGRPALVSLHTAAGLGHAVATLATARTNRIPLVALVGQQDRRHLLAEPFLAGGWTGWPAATRWRSSSRRGPRTCPAAWPRPGTPPRWARGRSS